MMEKQNLHPAETLEQVRYKLADGVSHSDFVNANHSVQHWIRQQPGFQYRTVCHNASTGEWVDLVYWATAADAQQASSHFMQQTECRALVAMIDPETITMQHSQVTFAEAGQPAQTTANDS